MEWQTESKSTISGGSKQRSKVNSLGEKILHYSDWRQQLGRRIELERTCLTESAISGPIPSPGKRVARIGACEEKALSTAADDDRKATPYPGRIPPERLPIPRLRMWEAIKISDQSFQMTRRRYFKVYPLSLSLWAGKNNNSSGVLQLLRPYKSVFYWTKQANVLQLPNILLMDELDIEKIKWTSKSNAPFPTHHPARADQLVWRKRNKSRDQARTF